MYRKCYIHDYKMSSKNVSVSIKLTSMPAQLDGVELEMVKACFEESSESSFCLDEWEAPYLNAPLNGMGVESKAEHDLSTAMVLAMEELGLEEDGPRIHKSFQGGSRGYILESSQRHI